MLDKFLYAYGDESGDFGFAFKRGSSHYFVITLILTNDPYPIRKRMTELRIQMGRPAHAEFKFYTMSNDYRRQFLLAIRPFSFLAYALVVDKTQLQNRWQRTKNETRYARCFAELVKRIPAEHLNGTILTLDQFDSPMDTKQAIRHELKMLEKQPFKRIKMKRSQSEDLIQCADVIAGAIVRDWQQETKFLKLIEDKVTVWIFPETKNPPS